MVEKFTPSSQRFYIFLRCHPGKTYAVGLAIAKKHLAYVTEISSISGKWDLLLRVVIDNRLDIGKLLSEEMLAVDGIAKTKTVIAYDVSE
jgi:DNA-binding Lrp family transcriptional regulator